MRSPAQQSPDSATAAGQARGQRVPLPAGRCTRGATPACGCMLFLNALGILSKEEECGLVVEFLTKYMPWKRLLHVRLMQQQSEVERVWEDRAHRHGNAALGQLQVIQEVQLLLRRLLARPRLGLSASILLRCLLRLCCRTQALQACITDAGPRLYNSRATCRACFGRLAAASFPEPVDSSAPYPS